MIFLRLYILKTKKISKIHTTFFLALTFGVRIFIIYNKENIYLKMMSEENFNKINENKKHKFFDEIIKTPKDFDKNFYKYFPLKHKIEYKSFNILETESRRKTVEGFLRFNFGLIKKYFGQPSIEKPITLIGSLK